MNFIQKSIARIKQFFEPVLPIKDESEDIQKLIYPTDSLHNTCIHESGHAILAWNSTIVGSVSRVYANPGNGKCFYTYYRYEGFEPNIDWCNIVISLGGIAAENLIYGKFRSGNSRADLASARDFATKLIGTTPRFTTPTLTKTTLPFKKMYIDLSDDEEKILQTAYQYAKKFILDHRDKHIKLADMLYVKRNILSEEIEEVLGNRFMVEALSTCSYRFIS